MLCATAVPVTAQTGSPAKPVWISVPRVGGHLGAADMGLVININDPYSLAVGEHYARQRGIPEPEARAMLTEAFIGQVIDRIWFEDARNVVRKWAAERLMG